MINWNSPKIQKEIMIGTKIEMEHTKDRKKAEKIAKDHIKEFVDYYSNKKYGLLHMEKMLEKFHKK